MMKKITLLFLLISTTIFAQTPPTGAAPTPAARDTADVISLFTQTTNSTTTTYNDITVANFNPNWGSTSGNVTTDAFGGDLALTYPNFDYQGIVIGSNIDVSGMTTLHVDIWTNNQSPNVYLISNSNGEKFVNVSANIGVWTSIEIPLTDYTNQGLNINDIKELKFATDSGPSGESIYIDNLYFSKPATDPMTDASLSDLTVGGNTISGFVPATTNYTYELSSGTTVAPTVGATTNNSSATTDITQASGVPGDATVVVTAADNTTMQTYTVSFAINEPATKAPTPPSIPAGSVKSIFSDAFTPITSFIYTDNGGTNMNTYNTNWCGANTSMVMIESNATNKTEGLGCEGIDFQGARIDASGLDTFHIDIWTQSETMDKSLNILLSQWSGGAGQDYALEYSTTNASSPVALPTTNPGNWISLDIPLSSFVNNVPPNSTVRNDIVQIVLVSDLGTVFYDNLYLYDSSSLSNDEFTKASFRVYPNPTQDSWTVNSENSKIEAINVFDVLGQQVLTFTPRDTKVSIDSSGLKSGLYFAQIKTANSSGNLKLVKK